jgi:hypothetical protein
MLEMTSVKSSWHTRGFAKGVDTYSARCGFCRFSLSGVFAYCCARSPGVRCLLVSSSSTTALPCLAHAAAKGNDSWLLFQFFLLYVALERTLYNEMTQVSQFSLQSFSLFIKRSRYVFCLVYVVGIGLQSLQWSSRRSITTGFKTL